MVEKLRVMLNTDNEALLQILVDDCKQYAINYCNLDAYDSALDVVVRQMVAEKFNKQNSDGINSRSYSGLSESYNEDFSPTVYKGLKRFRRLKTV